VSSQLPAVNVLDQTAVVKPGGAVVPAIIAAAGEKASWRYLEFFTANIRNPHTRRAYGRACARFFSWCARRGLGITEIRPFDVAAYIERLEGEAAAPSVKQELAAIRMLLDWLILGQVLSMNPAAAVRGPTHVVKTGKTPVLDGREWRRLLNAIPGETVRDRRDRALIATLTYSFARISAALGMKVDDLRARGAGWELRLREKGGKQHVIPCHHALAEELHAYINAAGIGEERKGWLFRTGKGWKATALAEQPMSQADAWRMDPPESEDCGHQDADRLPYLPRDRDYGVSGEWRDPGTRPGDGRARESAHHQALRPHQGAFDTR
jgi:site-specific recombinase XerD